MLGISTKIFLSPWRKPLLTLLILLFDGLICANDYGFPVVFAM
jgi:hypothetical protein